MSTQITDKSANIAKSFLFVLLFSAFIFINAPFITPLLLAGIFALGLQEFINKMNSATKISRGGCILITLFSGFALFLIPFSLAIYRLIFLFSQPQVIATDKIVSQVNYLKDYLISHLQQLSAWTGFDWVGPAQSTIETVAKRLGEILLKGSSDFLSQLPSTLLATLVFSIFVFVLLLRSSKIKIFFLRHSFFSPDLSNALIRVAKISCSSTIYSTLVIGAIQAFIVSIGSLIFWEGDFWLVLGITIFFSFIPIFGASPVGFLLAILAFIGGHTGSGIGLTVVSTLSASVDNFLKPMLIGGENKISPIVSFTSVIGSIIMIGLPGFLIGPVVMNLFVGTSSLLLKKNEPPLL